MDGERAAVASVGLAHMEALLATAEADSMFSAEELRDGGDGRGRVAALAARLAAKQACLQLFPHDAASGAIGLVDFTVRRDGYGAPHIGVSGKARRVLDRHRLERIALSLTHDGTAAAAVAIAEPARIHVPLVGKIMYYLVPVRRRVMLENMRRVFGGRAPDGEIVRLGQAHYAHYLRVIFEFFQYPWLSPARRAALVRVENEDAILRAAAHGRGVLVLTAHFGNWEVTTAAAAESHPQYRDKFHIVRRYLWPRWFYNLLANRLRRAGIGILEKKGSLDALLARLAAGAVVVFVLDQHAGGRDGVEVEFFNEPAWVFRSLAIIARATGAPVVPASCWRDAGGRHVMRFEEALPVIERTDPEEWVRENTRAYTAALEPLVLRHPEQWGMWMHRLWKGAPWAVAKPLKRRIAERWLKARATFGGRA